jgi:hypothetical protein
MIETRFTEVRNRSKMEITTVAVATKSSAAAEGTIRVAATVGLEQFGRFFLA